MIVMLLGGCGGGSSGGPDTANQAAASVEPVSQIESLSGAGTASVTNTDILQAVYLNQRAPEGFNLPSVADDGFYTIRHIRNTDIVSQSGKGAQAVFELSSDDFTEALQWSEQLASQESVYRQLVDVSETGLYYQFSRVATQSPQTTEYTRVFKRAMLDRDNTETANGAASNLYLGLMSLPSLSADNVRKVIEYLWGFSASNNYGYAVMSTDLQTRADEFLYTLLEAQLASAVTGGCDQISVVEKRYSVSRLTGQIYLTEVPAWSFYASPPQSSSGFSDNSAGSLCVPAGS